MNIASMLALLQGAASLLVLAQSPQATPAMMQGAINMGSNTVQVVAQANAKIGFPVPSNNSIWPNITDLLNAPYLDGNGNYVRLGSTVGLSGQYTSFGDINNDGIDDAAVILSRPMAGGAPNYFLAAMLNQGGIMFNIADFPLGNSVNINEHHVVDGKIVIDGNQYQLLGDTIQKVI